MTTATGISIGEKAPDFELPDTEGNRHSLDDGDANVTVMVFTCNHCPYALAWHDRIVSAANDYADRGVRFLAINSNDAERYPADSYEAMQKRVREEDWPLPYLHDESQDVAREFGAKTTPDVFVLDSDGTLRYRGAPDSDYGDPSQDAAWLRGALDAMLEVLALRPLRPRPGLVRRVGGRVLPAGEPGIHRAVHAPEPARPPDPSPPARVTAGPRIG